MKIVVRISMNYLDLVESFTTKVANRAKEKTQEEKRNDIVEIRFEDPEVERICHEHGVYTILDARKVTSIKEWFKMNENIKSFNEFKYFTGLKYIETYAFYACLSLQSINIPNSVNSIGSHAFDTCSSLQSINIPNSVNLIGGCAFYKCVSLKSIIIPNNVNVIGYSALSYCKSLRFINIPDGITSMKNLPNNITLGCKSLKKIYISKNHPLRDLLQKEYPFLEFDDSKNINESFTSNVVNKNKNTKQEDKREIVTEYVNLGLPSGNLWCTHNYGANTDTEYGKYVRQAGAILLSKYIEDESVVLPSTKDFEELVFNCREERISKDGIKGIEFISKINGKSIFFPFAGYGYVPFDTNNISSTLTTKCGYYWSCDRNTLDDKKGYVLFINDERRNPRNVNAVNNLFTFRLIKKRNNVNESFTQKVIKKVKETTQEDKRKIITDYVDLGLPSGLLWCKHNYGVNSEYDYGELYDHDEAMNLDMTPGRLPISQEFFELFSYTDHEYTELNGTVGELFTSKKNGESVFFPAGGVVDSTGNFHSQGKIGNYWSSSPLLTSENQYHSMFFREETLYPGTAYHKKLKFSVRSVLDTNKVDESFTSKVIDKKKTMDQEDKRKDIFNYVDLCLPSGTLWSTHNIGADNPKETGRHFSDEEAYNGFELPTSEDVNELYKYCTLNYQNDGILFVSKVDPKKRIYFAYNQIVNADGTKNVNTAKKVSSMYIAKYEYNENPVLGLMYPNIGNGGLSYSTHHFTFISPNKIRTAVRQVIHRKNVNESFTNNVIKNVPKNRDKIKKDFCLISTYIIRNLEDECNKEGLKIFDFAVHDNSTSIDDKELVEITFNLLYEDLDLSEDIQISIEINNGNVYISAHDYDDYYIDVKGYEIYGDSIKDKFNMLIDKLKSILYNVDQIVQQNREYDKYLGDQDNEATWNDPNYVRDEEGDVNEW